jgi:hypothetical protein
MQSKAYRGVTAIREIVASGLQCVLFNTERLTDPGHFQERECVLESESTLAKCGAETDKKIMSEFFEIGYPSEGS